MGDLIGGIAPGSGSAPKKRGRPKGARNKASGDLAKVFAHRAGVSPGEQLIEMVAVTAKDVRLAKEWAKNQPVVIRAGQAIDLRALPPRLLALNWRAHNLALMNGWDVDHAWAILMKGHDLLLPYVHQKQGAVEPPKEDKRPTILTDSAQLGSLTNPSQDIDLEPEFEFGPIALTHGGSQVEPETQEK